jgi:hypothetical protein
MAHYMSKTAWTTTTRIHSYIDSTATSLLPRTLSRTVSDQLSVLQAYGSAMICHWWVHVYFSQPWLCGNETGRYNPKHIAIIAVVARKDFPTAGAHGRKRVLVGEESAERSCCGAGTGEACLLAPLARLLTRQNARLGKGVNNAVTP